MLGLILRFPACAAGCEQEAAEPLDGSKYVAVVEATHLHLGRLQIGMDARREVTIINVSDKRIRLKILRKNCNCLEAHIDSPIVEVGESAAISFGTDVRGSIGAQRLVIEVGVSLEGLNPDESDEIVENHTFSLSFVPDLEFYVFPTQVAAICVAGIDMEFEVAVLCNENQPVDVHNVRISDPRFEVIQEEQLADGSGYIFAVRCSFPETCTAEAQFTFETSSNDYPNVGVPLSVRVETPWYALPSAIVFKDGGHLNSQVIQLELKPRPGGIRFPPRLGELHELPIGVERANVEKRRSGTLTLDVHWYGGQNAASDETRQIEVRDASGRLLVSVPIVIVKEDSGDNSVQDEKYSR